MAGNTSTKTPNCKKLKQVKDLKKGSLSMAEIYALAKIDRAAATIDSRLNKSHS